MKATFVPVGAAALLVVASSAAVVSGQPPEPEYVVSRAALETLLDKMKLKAEALGAKEQNAYRVHLDKFKGTLLLRPKVLQLSAGFQGGKHSLEQINDWNRIRPFARAYLEANGAAFLVSELRLLGGMPEKMIVDWFKHYQTLLDDFNAFLNPPKNDAALQELKALQGDWKVVRLISEGKQIDKESLEKQKYQAHIRGNRLVIHLGDKVLVEALVTVDPEKTPATIDLLTLVGAARGLVDQGVYTRAGDQFTIYMHRKQKAQAQRPTALPKAGVLDLDAMFLQRAEADKDEKAAVRQAVLGPQQAGWGKHDFKTYMSQWTDDARLEIARAEEAGKHDLVFQRPQIEATRRLLMHGPAPAQRKMAFENVEVKIEGEEAEVRLRATMTQDEDVEQVMELYRLKKTPAGWKVYLNRGWPVRTRNGGTETTFTAETWKKLDQAADDAVKEVDPVRHARALALAQRFREAHTVFKKITDRKDATAGDWVQRGHAALTAGDAGDALASFRRALKLDAEAPVPAFARDLPKNGAEKP